MYSKIVNPITNHKISVGSITGKKVLQRYLNQLGSSNKNTEHDTFSKWKNHSRNSLMYNLTKLTEENDHLKKEIELSNIEDYQTISRYVAKQIGILIDIDSNNNTIKWLRENEFIRKRALAFGETNEQMILTLNPYEIAKKLGINVKDTMADELMDWYKDEGHLIETGVENFFRTLYGYLEALYMNIIKYELEQSLIDFLNKKLDIYPKEDHEIIIDYVFRPESLNNWNDLNNEIQLTLSPGYPPFWEFVDEFKEYGDVDWDFTRHLGDGYSVLKKHWTDLLKSLDETRFNTKFFNTGPNITLEELKSMYEGHPTNMEEKLAAESSEVIDDDEE